MHFLQTDVVKIIDVPIRNHADVYALIETDRCLRFCVLLEQIMLFSASRDVWIKNLNVLLTIPKIRDIRDLYGTTPFFCGNI